MTQSVYCKAAVFQKTIQNDVTDTEAATSHKEIASRLNEIRQTLKQSDSKHPTELNGKCQNNHTDPTIPRTQSQIKKFISVNSPNFEAGDIKV